MTQSFNTPKTSIQSVMLYQIVYRSRFVWYAVFLLIVVFLVQPIEQAVAAEVGEEEPAEEAPAVANEPDVVSTQAPEAVEEEIVDEIEVDDEIEVVEDDTSTETIDTPNQNTAITDVVPEPNAADSVEESEYPADNSEDTQPKATGTVVTTVEGDSSTESTESDSGESISTVAIDAASTSATTALSTTTTNTGDSTVGGGETANSEVESTTATSTAATTTVETTSVTDEGETQNVDEVVEVVSSDATDNATTTVLNELPDIEDTIATTTVIQPPVVVDSYVGEFEFNANQCFEVGDGTFYCSKDTSKTVETVIEDDLFAAPDADGDLEIYLTINGETQKITDNQLDDSAPQFDSQSNTMVWHRLVNDRYQIIQYNYATQEETQLTDGRFNNMEPSVYGDYIAWQTWDGQDWEIALYDGELKEMITNNNVPDIGPMINDGYVIWNAVGAAGQKQVLLYDLATEQTEVIDDADGGAVSNPRFILVYDAEYDNGDVVTRGYDPDTGRVEPLSAIPGQLPKELPPVDQTGETRALIANKGSSGREDSLDLGDFDIETEPEPTASTTVAAVVATSTQVVQPPTELIIEKIDFSTTTETIASSTPIDPAEIIEDLIIPPLQGTTSDEAR